jgi:thiamine-phosphate pyrophosphorylase
VFFTDDGRVRDPLPSIRALPRGSMVVLRARDAERRRELARTIAAIARERGLVWIIAGDPHLAWATQADGVHFAERMIALAAHWRALRPHWLITCAAHSLAACARASRAGADAIFLAPVFPTQSHAGRDFLGPVRACFVASRFSAPLYALGGIDAHSARRLRGGRFSGLAAISALEVDRTQR